MKKHVLTAFYCLFLLMGKAFKKLINLVGTVVDRNDKTVFHVCIYV
jgi:hypothetical protein